MILPTQNIYTQHELKQLSKNCSLFNVCYNGIVGLVDQKPTSNRPDHLTFHAGIKLLGKKAMVLASQMTT